MKKLVVLLFFCVALFSCQKATYLSSSSSKLELNADENKGNISLSSDASNFELVHMPSWMEVALKDSTLTYNASKNVETFMRSDSIVVTCGDISLCIPITQYPRCTQLNSKESYISFKHEGETKDVEITTDGRPTISVEGSNIVAKYANGILTVTADPNTTDDPISGTITLTADDKTLALKYNIDGSKCATCKGTGRVKCPACGGAGYVPFGNCDIDACERCGGVSWRLHEGAAEREGTGRIKCPDSGGSGK